MDKEHITNESSISAQAIRMWLRAYTLVSQISITSSKVKLNGTLTLSQLTTTRLCFGNLPMTLPTLALSTVRVTVGRRPESDRSRNIKLPPSRAREPPSSRPECWKPLWLRDARSTLGPPKLYVPWNAVLLWYWSCSGRSCRVWHNFGGGVSIATPSSSYSSSQSDIFNMAADLPVRKFVKLMVRSVCIRKSKFPISGMAQCLSS